MSKSIAFEELVADPDSVFTILAQEHEPVVLTHKGQPKALLTPLDDGEEMRRLTAEELREEIQQAKADIAAGKGIAWEEVKRRLAGKLAEEAA
jgi:PHD/YefM family antitoxin component YafN of YafNO toxin-antitoxin module